MKRPITLSLTALAALLVSGCGGGADRDDTGAITAAGDVGVQDVRVGDCADEATGEVTSVGAIPCTAPHDYEVFHLFDLTGTELPDEEQIAEAVVNECAPVFESYVGTTLKRTKLDFGSVLTPSSDSWSQGDREVVCGAFQLKKSGEGAVKLTASVKGSKL